MKIFSIISICIFTVINAQQYRVISSELFHTLENAMANIYHISTDELQAIIAQDFGLIPHISADELKLKMQTNPDVLVVNVLTRNWYDDCHIKGSINVSLQELIYQADNWDRTREIVVYCALDECDASEKAYVLLRCMGFSSVLDYMGGIKEWLNLGYAVNGPCAAAYLYEDPYKKQEYAMLDDEFLHCLRQTSYIRNVRSKE